MGFDAGTVKRPQALSYDFTAVGVDAKGEIPEPTQGQIDDFQDVFKGLSGLNLTDVDLESVPDLAGLPALSRMVADLCSGTPSQDELKALPASIFDAFWGYVAAGFFTADAPNRAQRRNGTKPSRAAKTTA